MSLYFNTFFDTQLHLSSSVNIFMFHLCMTFLCTFFSVLQSFFSLVLILVVYFVLFPLCFTLKSLLAIWDCFINKMFLFSSVSAAVNCYDSWRTDVGMNASIFKAILQNFMHYASLWKAGEKTRQELRVQCVDTTVIPLTCSLVQTSVLAAKRTQSPWTYKINI